MEQGKLFDLSHPDMPAVAPHQPHSKTSKRAAKDVAKKLNALQERVLGYLRSKGKDGATDEEGGFALTMSSSTYRPRRIELVQAGLVIDSTKTRPGHSGKQMTVWIAKENANVATDSQAGGETSAHDPGRAHLD